MAAGGVSVIVDGLAPNAGHERPQISIMKSTRMLNMADLTLTAAGSTPNLTPAIPHLEEQIVADSTTEAAHLKHNSRPGTYTIDPRAERFEAIAREASWRMDQREKREEGKPCCSRCMRGTKALLGPCGYMRLCGCHTKGTP